jgi:hypothetical protein
MQNAKRLLDDIKLQNLKLYVLTAALILSSHFCL